MLLNKETQAVKDTTAIQLKCFLKGNNYLSAFSAIMLPYKVDVQRVDDWI